MDRTYVGSAKKRIRQIKAKNPGIPDHILIKAGNTSEKWLKDLGKKNNSEFVAEKVISEMESNARAMFDAWKDFQEFEQEVWKDFQEFEQEERDKEKKYWEKALDWTCPECDTKNEDTQFCNNCGLGLRDFYEKSV